MFDVKKYKREWAEKNKEKLIAYMREYRAKNKDKLREQNIVWRNENKERNMEYRKTYRLRNPIAFKERHSANVKKWRTLHPERDRYHSDPMYNLTRRIRSRLYEAVKCGKVYSTRNLIGCTFETLKLHIESKFENGMTWDNKHEWHIDHIVPLSSATSEDELKMLAHYTNLQPMWAKDNLSKSSSTSHLSSPWPRVA